MKIERSILRIIGLLGEMKEKDLSLYEKNLHSIGYVQDLGPLKEGALDKESEQYIKDYFYPDFRKSMFLQDDKKNTVRYIRNHLKPVTLKGQYKSDPTTYHARVTRSEIYLFKNQIGLFSLNIELAENADDLDTFSKFLNVVRSFKSKTEEEKEWIDWISEHYLNGQALRGENVLVDDFSGSKFKLFIAVDGDFQEYERSHLLYDLATASRIGSAGGEGVNAPDPHYFNELMQKRITVFKNCEALCLFDSFCCVGNNQLESFRYDSWGYTYFRIYLYRLFFKYNLYRYNSMIHLKSEDTVNYRDQFESFLNIYNISHISFNFLGNELFKKTGEALELDNELKTFRERINNLSATIQETRQRKTNILLGLVTALSGVQYVGPGYDILKNIKEKLEWNDFVFFLVVGLLVLIIGAGIFYYLFPEKIKKWLSRK